MWPGEACDQLGIRDLPRMDSLVFKTPNKSWDVNPLVRRKAIQTPDRLFGTSRSGHLDLPWLHGILGRLGPGVNELMCHPAMETSGLKARYAWNFAWGTELDALTDRSTLKLVEEAGIRLISYGGLS